MSYLFVVLIGAIAGWVAGQSIKGSELGVIPDLIAGAGGAAALVLFVRIIGSDVATGFVTSTIVAIIGAVAGVYAMRYAMREAPAPARRPRR